MDNLKDYKHENKNFRKSSIEEQKTTKVTLYLPKMQMRRVKSYAMKNKININDLVSELLDKAINQVVY